MPAPLGPPLWDDCAISSLDRSGDAGRQRVQRHATLRKNNTGYDLKQCFVGSEARWASSPGEPQADPGAGLPCDGMLPLSAGAPLAEMLAVIRRTSADLVSSFEYITTTSLGLVGAGGPLRAGAGGRPSARGAIGLHGGRAAGRLLVAAVENSPGPNGSRMRSGLERTSQRNEMWALRESIPEASAGPAAR